MAVLLSKEWIGVVSTFRVSSGFATWGDWNVALGRLGEWLLGFTHPVGVVAADDLHASMVSEACRDVRLRVPQDVAVLGVGNEEMICERSDPPLSSIALVSYQIGFEAAALLDRLMAGEDIPPRDVLLAPKGVVTRGSTDVLAIENPHVRTVVDYIREHTGDGFGVELLARLVPISRRSLEFRFRKELGCSPHEYLCRVRVAKAKDLLVSQRNKKLHEVAAECGFADSRRLRLVFEALTGMTPAAYRRTTHGAASALSRAKKH